MQKLFKNSKEELERVLACENFTEGIELELLAWLQGTLQCFEHRKIMVFQSELNSLGSLSEGKLVEFW